MCVASRLRRRFGDFGFLQCLPNLGLWIFWSPRQQHRDGVALVRPSPAALSVQLSGGLLYPTARFYSGLLIIALISLLLNSEETSSTKEYLLLVASLAGYLACRPMLAQDAAVVRSAFTRITAVIVLVGTVFTAAEIFSQWDGPPGRPLVFGFNAAGTYFMVALGFLVIALVTVDKPRPKRTAVICALIFLPTVVFAAAMVQFTFLALAGSLFVAMILSRKRKTEAHSGCRIYDIPCRRDRAECTL